MTTTYTNALVQLGPRIARELNDVYNSVAQAPCGGRYDSARGLHDVWGNAWKHARPTMYDYRTLDDFLKAQRIVRTLVKCGITLVLELRNYAQCPILVTLLPHGMGPSHSRYQQACVRVMQRMCRAAEPPRIVPNAETARRAALRRCDTVRPLPK